ncbi:MAG: anhydro-N-acetylmuramic acid kinase [Sideroxydans sp.]|nr:anhydro-N-acetylmuramic acid kinase [Sideroxydans sp.]
MKTASELYIGIMSGTSLDGIDVALVEFGEGRPQLRSSHYQSYPRSLKDVLLELHQSGFDEIHRTQLASITLARAYADATYALLHKAGISPSHIQAIGCHGQTIRHRPEQGYTVQLGNSAFLAELTGIHVVSDFRSRDIAAGGQGAPLVPAFHDTMLRHPTIHRAILNLGGISNLTDLEPGCITTGFDTGPGNLLLDSWISKHLARPYDQDGEWASSGKSIPSLLQRMLTEPYFAAPPPKSTGRDLFNMAWLENHLDGTESPADVQATLLSLTCDSIAEAVNKFCVGTDELLLCGGGAHNAALISLLQQRLPLCRIQKTDALDIPADWMEAIAFAWLARQTMHLHPGNLPAATGATHPCVLGAIYPA